MTKCVLVSTTLPDEAAAQRVATCAVEQRLAACAQVQGPITSTYRWQGQVAMTREWYCHLKTTDDGVMALQKRIRELHPYEVPEILVVAIVEGDAGYLRWIEETVSGAKHLGP